MSIVSMKSTRQPNLKVEIQTQSLEIQRGQDRLMIRLWDLMTLLKVWMTMMIEGDNWMIINNNQMKSI